MGIQIVGKLKQNNRLIYVETQNSSFYITRQHQIVIAPPIRLTIVSGHGRSGTNLLLDLLDTHQLTNCRNEPEGLGSSLLNKRNLDTRAIVVEPELEQKLRSTLDAMRFTKGIGDRFSNGHKAYINRAFRTHAIDYLLSHGSARALASHIMRRLKNEEWSIPQYCIKQTVGNKVELVVKLGQSYRACALLLEQNTSMKIVHIVRSPIEVLKSWESRYFAVVGQDKVKQENYERLKQVLQVEPQWLSRFGNIETLSAHETEFLYWMYGNETLFERGRLNKNYFLVAYSSLIKNPEKTAEEIFSFLGLSFDSNCAQRVKELRNVLFRPTTALTTTPVDFIQNHMRSSSLRCHL